MDMFYFFKTLQLALSFQNVEEDLRRATFMGRHLSPGGESLYWRAYFRITRKAFANPEDAGVHGKGEQAKKYVRTDQDVERVRRCHLNDLENIVPFFGIGLLYALSGPDLYTALLHFRIFVGSRVFHSISYLVPLPQPCRALSFFVGFCVTISMAYRLLSTSLYL
ncbi:microsomal glutathione S-transferase 1-like [Ambystoma mexicanum]|uniref:microsomal glutathione S-transferase 1-like n=1 Tax=Ambystoma mexicanum TaxID=8296 RepID=UPI0037E994C2